jgi:AhpD family alkylhydroperoxidase
VSAREPVSPLVPLVRLDDAPTRAEGAGSAERGILNLHRMMAHAPALMKASGDMAFAFRRDTRLPRDLAEIAVLRTAQVADCAYVWERHLDLARTAGVTEQQIGEIAHWPKSDVFTPAQKAALAFAEKAALRLPIEPSIAANLQREFSDREIVELAMLVGFYVSSAIFIKALAVPAEKA